MSIEQVKQIVIEAGHKVGYSWEDDDTIYAASTALRGRGPYATPKIAVTYRKGAKTLSTIKA
jgi:hypothetical protein